MDQDKGAIKGTIQLIHAIEQGDTETALALLSFCDPKRWNSQALWTAAIRNDIVMTKALLPLSEPFHPACKAFEVAASTGCIEIVQTFISAMSPADMDIANEAFRRAILAGQTPCAQLLYDVCEPEKALQHIYYDDLDSENRMVVDDCLAQLQHARIGAQVNATNSEGARRKI